MPGSNPTRPSLGKAFAAEGYDTAYIGKWHVDGHGRDAPIPPERRQGFQFWKVLECTHDYRPFGILSTASPIGELRYWEGYDAIAETREAQRYIREPRGRSPVPAGLLGPPHDPYRTAPEPYRSWYDRAHPPPAQRADEHLGDRLRLPRSATTPIAPRSMPASVICCARSMEAGIADDTIFIFTSDHGDAVGCHGHGNKQAPWDESIMVPFLLRYPARFGRTPRYARLPARRAGYHADAARPVRAAHPERRRGDWTSPVTWRAALTRRTARRCSDRQLSPDRGLVARRRRPRIPWAAHQTVHLRSLAGRAVDAVR